MQARERRFVRVGAVVAAGLVAVSVLAGSAPAARHVGRCNGLLAFASNRAVDVNRQLYRIQIDGSREDIGGSLEGEWDPQPSPDGTRLAFWSARPGGGLLVANLDGTHPRRMQIPGSLSVLGEVTWSPDSKRFALTVADNTSRIEVFDADSGVGHMIAAGWSPEWSPDGQTIAFQTYDGVSVVVPDGSGLRVLTHRGAPETLWSPDGARLLAGDSVVTVADGSVVSLGTFSGFAWMPDSSRLLAEVTGGGIWSVAADGTDPHLIAADGSNAALSPNGRMLVFLRAADHHVLITDIDGQPMHDLGAWDSGPSDLHMRFVPRWSPDGSQIAFWSGGKVIVAEATGTTQTLAGGRAELPDQPVWEPDGNAVLVAVADTTGNTDIYVSQPDGTGVRRVYADSVPEGGPSWSPDGRSLAFIRYSRTPTLVVSDLAGHVRVLMRRRTLAGEPFLGGGVEGPPFSTDGSSWPGSPAWSPDGRKIAVASTEGILSVDVHTHAVRPLGPGVYPAWSRTGAIAYTEAAEGGTITVFGRSIRRFPVADFYDPAEEAPAPGLATNLAWAPDGTRLAYLLSGVDGGTGWVEDFLDSIRIIDTRTGKARKVAAQGWGFAWSPDGRYFVQGGFNATITRTNGRVVAKLTHLRALQPSWQPRCNGAA